MDIVKHLRVGDLCLRVLAEWQPIETAPKDGTRVLVYAPGHLLMIGTWLEHSGYYFGPAWWSNGVTIAPPPTHWMPLPPPPITHGE